MNNHPIKDKLRNVIVETTVPNITKKDEQSITVKKILTMNMLEEKCAQEIWIRMYTDGSATNATMNSGAGIYIM